jgi:6-phosphogluconolactonase
MRLIASLTGFLMIGMALAPAPGARAQRLVYIGTYTEKTASKGIYAFRFDDSSGALTPVGLVAETPGPSFLTASANGKFVYAVNELQQFGGAPGGSVTAFAVDPGTAKLTQLNVQATRGGSPCHLVLDKTGRYLAVANYSGGNYALFPVNSDGR